VSRSRTPKGGPKSQGSSRSSGEPRTQVVQAPAEVRALHPPSEPVSPTTAVLDEFRAITRCLERVERLLFRRAQPEPVPGRQTPVLTDDTIVDQRTGLVPKDVYLRLARAGAFPSRKHGKRVLARWGDVHAAVLGGPGIAKAVRSASEEEPRQDDLDDLRRQLGLAAKGK
jgi:hypothetical protein